jgi:hypothetical protein
VHGLADVGPDSFKLIYIIDDISFPKDFASARYAHEKVRRDL